MLVFVLFRLKLCPGPGKDLVNVYMAVSGIKINVENIICIFQERFTCNIVQLILT